MYFLLRNKHIHSDADKKIKFATYDFNNKKMCINGGKWQKWVKSSKDVSDLVEVGDLVRYKNDFLGVDILEEVYKVDGRLVVRDYYEVNSLCIIEIHKYKKSGIYKKVWDRSEER